MYPVTLPSSLLIYPAERLPRSFTENTKRKSIKSQQRALAAQKASRTLGCTPSCVGSRAREGILLLCSTLVRLPQESCIQLWSPQHRTDMDLLEQGQRRPKQ